MTDDDPRQVSRRTMLAATAGLTGLTGLSGCVGALEDAVGDEGPYEGADLNCQSIEESSFRRYDASGIALLFDFEYPTILDGIEPVGGPNPSGPGGATVRGTRYLGGEGFEDRLRLQVVQRPYPIEQPEKSPPTVDVEQEIFDFGGHRAYRYDRGDRKSRNDALLWYQFLLVLPHETDQGVQHFQATINMRHNVNPSKSKSVTPDCKSIIEAATRTVAHSVQPNPDNTFTPVYPNQ